MKQIIPLFTRDLNVVKKEILAYQDEANIWKTASGIHNSAGNLVLHLIGNLNHFIGTILGKTDYVRNREAEFSDKFVPRQKLLDDLDKTIHIIETVLENLSDDDWSKEYPLEVLQQKWRTDTFVIHLAMHLDYHLGQINYHRRLLTL